MVCIRAIQMLRRTHSMLVAEKTAFLLSVVTDRSKVNAIICSVCQLFKRLVMRDEARAVQSTEWVPATVAKSHADGRNMGGEKIA